MDHFKSTNYYGSLLYYYTILHSFIISGDINLSFGIYSSVLTAFKLFCDVFRTFVVLSAILLPNKQLVVSAVL